jgi:uncharacterized membrane protein
MSGLITILAAFIRSTLSEREIVELIDKIESES